MLRTWAGIVDVTPDASPVIGLTPVDGLYVNCGWGTGGFKATPAAGAVLADPSRTTVPIRSPSRSPWSVIEFHYGGQAHVGYPENPRALTDAQWAQYLFVRDNPEGQFAERWVHSAGCRRWFNTVRDTATNVFAPVTRPNGVEADR